MLRSVLVSFVLLTVFEAGAQIYTGAINTPFRSGQLNTAFACAVDPRNGNLFVADQGRSKILKFVNGVFSAEFGAPGIQSGQFCNITGIAVSTKGNIFVVDFGTGRIQKFDENLTFVSRIDNFTINCQAELFETPTPIAVDDAENVYVSLSSVIRKFPSAPNAPSIDWGEIGIIQGAATRFDAGIQYLAVDKKRNLVYAAHYSPGKSGLYISRYNNAGGLEKTWQTATSVNERPMESFGNSGGLGVDDNSNVYLIGSGAVQKFSQDGALLSGYLVSPGAEAKTTGTATVDATGNVYIPHASFITKFNQDGAFNSSIGTALDPGQLADAVAAAADAQGNLYVIDQPAHTVNKFDITGKFVAQFGGFGSDPGKLNYPMAIAVDNSGAFYIADYGNHRVQKFNSNGVFLTQFGSLGTSDGQFDGPKAITIDKDQNIWVADDVRLQKFNTSGTHLSTIVFPKILPNGLTNEPDGNLIMLRHDTYLKVSPTGTILQLRPEFGGVTGIACDKDHNVYISRRSFSSIQVRKYTSDGTLRSEWGGYPNAIALDRGKNTIYLVYKNYIKKYEAFHINDPGISKIEKGTELKLTGSGFSETPANNIVKFNKTPGIVTKATPNELTVQVPADATTGKIYLQRDSAISATRDEVIVLPYSITGLNPGAVLPGDSVGIVGTGFSSIKGRNQVFLDDRVLATGLSSPNLVRAWVPLDAKPGKITIKTGTEVSTWPVNLKLTKLRINKATFPTAYVQGQSDATAVLELNNAAEAIAAKVYYRGLTNGTTAASVAGTITPSGVNTINVSIPKSIFTDPLGSEVYIAILDVDGNEITTGRASIKLTYNPTVQPLTLANLRFGSSGSDYQLVSFPMKFEDNRVSQVLKDLEEYDDKKWRMFSYLGGNQEMNKAESGILPGRGYWLIVKDEKKIQLGTGTTVDVPFQLQLNPGWNLIGNPYNFAISWSDVKAFNGNITSVGDLRFFSNGTYSKGDVLQNFKGAFVKLDGNAQVTLLIPPKTATGNGRVYRKELPPIDQVEWEVPFRLEDGQIVNELAGIGMNPLASKELDRFDETEIPAPDGVNTFQFHFNRIGSNIIHKDIVSTTDNYSWTGNITNENGLTLRWDNSFFGNNEKQLVIDIEGQAGVIDMRRSASVIFHTGATSFRIHYGDKAYVEKMTIGKEPLAGHLAPNPLRRAVNSVSMAVSIPEGGGVVDLTITDITGKEHSLAHNLEYSEGRHTIELNPDLTNLPSGLYIVRTTIRGKSYNRVFFQKVIID